MVSSAVAATGSPVAPSYPSFSSYAPSLFGQIGQHFMSAAQPRFASNVPQPGGGVGPGTAYGLGGHAYGIGALGGQVPPAASQGGGGMAGFDPMALALLASQRGPGGYGGGMPDYGKYGLLGQGIQQWLGPQSQTGWNMGTTTQSAAPGFFGRMFGGG